MAMALRRGGAGAAARENRANGDETGPGRGRVAAARGAWAVGSVMLAIARLVRLLVGLVVLIIVAAIVLRVASANPGNVIVRDIHDVGQTLVGPFKNVFTIKDPKADMAANWGLAAVVWAVVGGFVASLIARAAPSGVRPSRSVT
jgi:protein-S-isoprenylcysteine O-methyltransferase Ste14